MATRAAEALPTVAIFAGGEGTDLEVPAVRRGGLFPDIEVQWALSAPGCDVTATSGTVCRPAGVDRASITLRAVDDDIPEDKERCALSLIPARGLVAINASLASITLQVVLFFSPPSC